MSPQLGLTKRTSLLWTMVATCTGNWSPLQQALGLVNKDCFLGADLWVGQMAHLGNRASGAVGLCQNVP